MKPIMQEDTEAERRTALRLWDMLIRIGLIVALGALCFQALSPFLRLLVWSIVLAITIYPLHQKLARRIGGKQGLTSTILVLVGITLIVVPTWLLMNSFADSIQSFIGAVQQNTLQIPEPGEGVKSVPIVGNKIYGAWSKAHTDLPGLVQSMQPKLGELARDALGMVANIAKSMGSGCTNFKEVVAVTGGATSYTDLGLVGGTTYRYRVRAYNIAGNSPYSTIASAKTSRR